MPSADRPEDSAQSERKTASGSAAVDREIEAFVDAASRVLGSDLRSIVLFGSAAEGKLRATSDVNVVLVLSAFDPAKVDSLREPLRTAHAAVRLSPMILLESEIPSAAEAFAEKFSDILRRRRVLHGSDPFAGVSIPRSAAIGRLRQVLLNLVLRLREQYVLKKPSGRADRPRRLRTASRPRPRAPSTGRSLNARACSRTGRRGGRGSG